MCNWSLDSQQPHFIATEEEFESTKKRFLEAVENGQIMYWNNNKMAVNLQISSDQKINTTTGTNTSKTPNNVTTSTPTPPLISMRKTSQNNKISILNRAISRGRPQKNMILKIRRLRKSEIDYWHDRKETEESDSENHKLWLLCASDKEKKNLLKIPEQSKYLIKYLYRPLFLYKLHPTIFNNPVKNVDFYDLFDKL